jgi:dolichyl-phosphate-mannose-protein mannosyltransferase
MTGGTNTPATITQPFRFTISRRWLVLGPLLLVGLLVRFWAMRWSPFLIDMNTFIAWGERLRQVGPSDFYQEGYFADYTPGYLYVLWLLAEVKHALVPTASSDWTYVLHRLPATICDLAIAVVLFNFIEHRLRRPAPPDRNAHVGDPWPVLPAVVAALWLFNPAVVFNAAIWGQVDAIVTLPMLLALIFLIDGRPEAATVSYVVAFLIKPHAVTIAPVVGLALFVWFPLSRALRAIGVGVLSGVIILMPFFGIRFLPGLWNLLTDSREYYAYTSLFSYNLWGIYGSWRDDRLSVFGPLSARGIGIALLIVGLTYGLIHLWRELRHGAERAYTLFLFSTYFAFMPVVVLTTMHERYIYPVLVFLLIFAALSYVRRTAEPEQSDHAPRFLLAPFVLYLALTVLHTMNL